MFNLTELGKKKVEVSFSLEETSNDGGLLLLNEVDHQIGLIDRISGCINDVRHQGYVKHRIDSMLRQRIMQIAAGYEDANDCNALKDDGILKLCAHREQPLASQPTMCRLENLPGKRELYRMAKAFIDHFIDSYESPPGIIILDCDDTNSYTYGQQELALFNTYYGDSCYMPLHIYEGLSGKLINTLLKPGRRSKSLNVFGILQRIIAYLREYWPDTMIIVRGDSHFCSKELMDWAHDLPRVEVII
ncbi:MAG: IS1380 family transposase [Bacteroidales bacterium]|nr:IS1380 family transposase [Bacteroidales bacterium]